MKISNSPPIVKILFLTLVTVIIWISFDVYRALTIDPSLEVPEEILKELDPTLDAATLNQLQNRIYVSEEQIADINIIPKDSVDENSITTLIEEEEVDNRELIATESGQEQ